MELNGLKLGVAICGSFCTFRQAFETVEKLNALGAETIPIMSYNAASLSTRFGRAEDNVRHFEELTGKKVIMTIEEAEPIGPKKMLDILLLPNCTGNTLAKLANSITDTPVTMAVKSHLRIGRPVLINVATNDALAGSAKNIGALMNLKHYFFVPLRQDDWEKKPNSIVGHFEMIPEAVEAAMEGKQMKVLQ